MADEFKGKWVDIFRASDVDGKPVYNGHLEIEAEVAGKFKGKYVKDAGAPIDFENGVCRVVQARVFVNFQIADGDLIYLFRGEVTRPALRRVDGMYWAFKKSEVTVALVPDASDTGGWGGSEGGA
jgi:hypothetical protein